MVKDNKTGQMPRVFSVALWAGFVVNLGYEKIYVDFGGFVVGMYIPGKTSRVCFSA